MATIDINSFCVALQDMLQTEEDLTPATQFKNVEEWDSVSFMVVIAYFDKTFGRRVSFDQLVKCSNVADLIRLAGGDIA